MNELFASFKLQHPEVKLGYSKFRLLRTQWCLLAGAAGTNSVCAPVRSQYKDLIKYIVCDTGNEGYMDCPKSFIEMQRVVQESLP